MKFLCVDCDAQMASIDQINPGDGTLSIVFRCPKCQRAVAMLANPMETQMVSSLCVQVGGRATPEQPFEGVRSQLKSGGETALEDTSRTADPAWSEAAEQRLARIPGFVRGMVRRLYVDWAESNGISEITVEVMDKARAELGLEGM